MLPTLVTSTSLVKFILLLSKDRFTFIAACPLRWCSSLEVLDKEIPNCHSGAGFQLHHLSNSIIFIVTFAILRAPDLQNSQIIFSNLLFYESVTDQSFSIHKICHSC